MRVFYATKIFINMNIKKIIREEVDELSWMYDAVNTPLTELDKAEIIERFIKENKDQLKEANNFTNLFWKEYGNVVGDFSVNDLRNVATVMFAQQFKSK